MNIVPLIIKHTGRSPPRGQRRGGREGREGGRSKNGGNIREEKLCRSMKNCSGILPPQLAVWEADLISGESIWLELWEITLLSVTSVTTVETCPDGGGESLQRLWYFILAICAFKDISTPVTVLKICQAVGVIDNMKTFVTARQIFQAQNSRLH